MLSDLISYDGIAFGAFADEEDAVDELFGAGIR